MQASSAEVTSNQSGLHPRLARTVLRHLSHPNLSPLAPHNQSAWDTLLPLLQTDGRPLVLDSFCGTGMSTAQLALRHPQHLVIGVDKSGHRLQRHLRNADANYLLLQAECEPLWRQLASAGMRVDHHYLLYPNPWPKSRHLRRRIHGHPGFRDLLALGGLVELRSNWPLYVEEFGVAMHLAGVRGAIRQLPAAPALTRFEDKYRRSGQVLWQYQGRIGYSDHLDTRN